nr:cardiolipin synthase [Geomicrobium halophilum]
MRGFLDEQLRIIITIIYSIAIALVIFVIFMEKRNPTRTLTWVIVLVAFPGVGFIFYLIFGHAYRHQRSYTRKASEDEQAFESVTRHRSLMQANGQHLMPGREKFFHLALKLGSPISFNTETKVLADGRETFAHMLYALEQAEHHIHIEFYTIRHDDIGNQFKQILLKKARDGVEVRVLYDAVGSWQLPKAYKNELRQAGVDIKAFAPVRIPLLNHRVNYRNHRKIVVIDGQIGFTGGLNIGDEYVGKGKLFRHWRDSHLYMKGEAVRDLQLTFLRDWSFMTGETKMDPVYLSPEHRNSKIDEGGVQVIAGGPDQQWEVIKKLFFKMITNAKKSIWIASPYFIPDDDILSALKIAALSGIDVRLLMPSKPDKRVVFHASRSYYPELVDAGVVIYAYDHGFMHSKFMIVDQEIASLGSANMDMRSFHLNFEVNVFLYETSSVSRLVSDYVLDMEHSSVISAEALKKRPFRSRMMESFSRLLSPLL